MTFPRTVLIALALAIPELTFDHSLTIASEVNFGDDIKVVDGVGSFARIPAGEFRMGSAPGNGQSDERPVRTVKIDEFWLMHAEVSVGAYKRFAQQTNYTVHRDCWYFRKGWKQSDTLSWQSPGFEQTDAHPVTCVSWHDAKAFIDWLNKKSKKTFRLPTEAEWEYAARAGSTDTHYLDFTKESFCDHANIADQSALEDYPGFSVVSCDDGFTRTAPVGDYKPNPWGLHDMYGNVWEWVEDCWNDHYNDAPVNGEAWLEGDCKRRGFRGGGYGDISTFARSALRNRAPAGQRKDDIGFRLVMEAR